MVKKLVYRMVLSLLVCSLGQAVYAGNYKVELLVFAQNSANSELFEQTDSTIKWPAQMSEIEAPAVASQTSVTLLPVTGLISPSARIAQDKNYKLLLQTAWMQTLNYNQPGRAVHFAIPGNTLDGFITITVNPALNVHLDAEYTPVKLNNKTAKPELNIVYRLTENRQLKPNEIHYFDHPKFGVITLISPLSP